MGANNKYYDVSITEALNAYANKLRNSESYEHGRSGYTGTIAEDNGKLSVIITRIFPSRDDAVAYIQEHAEKWEDSIAVLYYDEQEHVQFLIGGCYSY